MQKGLYTLCVLSIIAIVVLAIATIQNRIRVNTGEEVRQNDKKNQQGSIPRPSRIVSANLGADQILLEMVPERIVAVSHLTLDPRLSHVTTAATQIPHRLKPDPEQILVLRPDLVVLGRMSPAALFSPIEGSGAKVFRFTEYQSISGIEKTVLELGGAVGASDRASEIVSIMRKRLDEVGRKVASRPKPSVVYYNLGGFTGGKGTFIDNIIERAGGHNMTAAAGIYGSKKISLESLIDMDPDVLVIMSSGRWDSSAENAFASQPAIEKLRASINGKVFVMSPRYLFAPSQHVVEAVEDLARFLHPEAFGIVTGARNDLAPEKK